jgi:hypothetical protein
MKQDIKCPKCSWYPSEQDLWMCDCNTVWNTFETAGECPGCKNVWTETQCLECHKWSAHIDWYSDIKTKLIKEMAEFSVYI